MLCNCCSNRIWVEPNRDSTITIYSEGNGLRYGYRGNITIGITVQISEADGFINQLRDAIVSAIHYSERHID